MAQLCKPFWRNAYGLGLLHQDTYSSCAPASQTSGSDAAATVASTSSDLQGAANGRKSCCISMTAAVSQSEVEKALAHIERSALRLQGERCYSKTQSIFPLLNIGHILHSMVKALSHQFQPGVRDIVTPQNCLKVGLFLGSEWPGRPQPRQVKLEWLPCSLKCSPAP